jgi:hypothetical protein
MANKIFSMDKVWESGCCARFIVVLIAGFSFKSALNNVSRSNY